MSHKGIRKLIEDTAKGLQDDIQYSYGKDTDFNQDRKKSPLMINTSPLVSVPAYRSNNATTNYMKQWNVEMAFYKFDSEASKDYAEILDQTDWLVDNFINTLNFFSPLSGTLTIGGINQTPFIKVTADILTGHILTFQMLVSDNFDYCEEHDC